ncbi:MAG TPA: hypothetical protein ENK66_04555, partial [Arcobacter sp.]|nr:hypothetical protein [Arcobacter sp.]
MRQLQTLRNVIFLSILGISFISCGGGSGSSSSDVDTITDKKSGVLVDPYITGAILCEDLNKNGTCDEGEQTSSATNSNGVFTFDNNLTAGSHIIIDTQGYHNDVPYTLDISGVVDDNGSIDVISPLTALLTKGLTSVQIVTMLQNAGLTNITEEDITANPLEGGINSLNTNNKLRKLHATLAVYGMLKTIEGSDTLNNLSVQELVTSAQIGGEVNQILTAMVSGITSALSEDTIANVQTQVDMYENQMSTPPEVSVRVVASTAVTAIDALTKIAYEACNQTDGNDSEKVENALQAFNNS